MIQKILNSDFFKRGIKTILLRGAGVLLSFALLWSITNLYSDTSVGEYQYFNSILIVLGAISLMGLNVSFIPFSSEIIAEKKDEQLKQLYYKNVLILIFTSTLLTIFYFVIRLFLFPQYITIEDDTIYKYVLLALFPNSLSVLNFQVILGLRLLFISEFFRNIIKFTIIIFTVLIFYFLGEHTNLIYAFIVSFIIIAIISTIGVLWALNTKYELKKLDVSKNSNSISFQKIIKTSIPMTLSSIALLLMQQMDVLVLENYATKADLAYYGVALKLSMTISIILTAINQTISPKIAEFYFKNNFKELQKILYKSILMTTGLALPIALILSIFPNQILTFFGENYSKATGAMLILIMGQLFNALAGSTDLYLNMTGKQVFFQKVMMLALALNVILNFILIPLYGMNGAAWSTTISLTFWNITSIYYIKKKDNIWVVFNKNMFSQS